MNGNRPINKRMNNNIQPTNMNRTFRLVMCLFCLAAIVSCQQEEEMTATDPETVTLTLNIGTQSSVSPSTRADDPNVLPYEGIRTLRVLVISDADNPSDREILYNDKRYIDTSTNPTSAILSANLTLTDIPVGMASIYLIANEESIGMKYTDEVLTGDTYKDDNKLLLLDEGWTHFPKTYSGIAEYGLPMSGRNEHVDINAKNTNISLTLERAVVKLRLTVENATSDELTLEWVKFGQFISDRVYLFRQQNLDIPSNTLYKELRYPETDSGTLNVTLAKQAQTQWRPVYVYPSFAYKDPTGANPYTLSLKTDKKEYSPSLLSANINSMVRNTQFNILARITASATIQIEYSFVPWDEKDVDVPSFD